MFQAMVGSLTSWLPNLSCHKYFLLCKKNIWWTSVERARLHYVW